MFLQAASHVLRTNRARPLFHFWFNHNEAEIVDAAFVLFIGIQAATNSLLALVYIRPMSIK